MNLDYDKLFPLETLKEAWARSRARDAAPGSDGVSASDFEDNLAINLETLRADLLEGRYEPFPYRRFYVPDRTGGPRDAR